MLRLLKRYRRIWLADFEFDAPPGERPRPRCLVAWELRTGAMLRIWEDELLRLEHPPYDTGDDALFIAYFASAELGCHAALGWPMPERVLDLFTEFRALTNGRDLRCGAGLLGALAHFGLDAIDATEKQSMRELVLRGGPYTRNEITAVLDYCESDVRALGRLLPAMLPRVDLPRALLRGRYMTAVARMEHNGVPIDTTALATLRNNWSSIQRTLVARIDADYGVYEGTTFKRDRWSAWLAANGIPWPRLPSGALDLSDDTFRQMARAYPAVAPMRELRYSLSKLRLADLAVGSDGRNRCLLSPFRARTSRNQPSNSRFIFGPAVWLRGLIRPAPGRGLAYVDWSQQEFGIAAALSGDVAMRQAYQSGDPYLSFAKQAGAVPPDATKDSHGAIRDQYKACSLGVQYGMGAESLAMRIGEPVVWARELLRRHRETYPRFWRWSDAVIDHAMLHNTVWTVFGWPIHIGSTVNPRSLRNFPMQANGAEMLRLACCLATERGLSVCAPVHDALLLEAPVDRIDDTVAATRAAMAEASRVVLDGFELRTDAEVVRYPDRYMDKRGRTMWDTIWSLVGEPPASGQVTRPPVDGYPSTGGHPPYLLSHLEESS